MTIVFLLQWLNSDAEWGNYGVYKTRKLAEKQTHEWELEEAEHRIMPIYYHEELFSL